MLPWGRKNRNTRATEPAPPAEPPAGDWDFLRDQPDHDADLMAEVHGEAASQPGTPAVTPPVRRPARLQPPAAPTAAPRTAGTGEHATRPLTLLSDLCARFQQDQPLGDEAERFPFAPPTWALSLRVDGPRPRMFTCTGEVILGRRDPETGWDPDIPLSDDTVSRKHARIYQRSGRFWLQDLDSMNGTRHNGEWLTPRGEVMLSEGDRIQLGENGRVGVVDPAFENDEPGIRDFVLWALTETIDAERASAAPTRPGPSQIRTDVLDLALRQGAVVGLVSEAHSQ